jgi:hypothetical protein
VRAFGGGPSNREQSGDDSPTTTTVRVFGGSPLTRVSSPDFSESACESSSIPRGTPRELRAIHDHEARGESYDSKRAAKCLGQGQAQQVAQTMTMEHHLRQMLKGKVSV